MLGHIISLSGSETIFNNEFLEIASGAHCIVRNVSNWGMHSRHIILFCKGTIDSFRLNKFCFFPLEQTTLFFISFRLYLSSFSYF